MSDKGIDILKAIQDTGEYPKDSDISPVMVVLESQEPIAYEFDVQGLLIFLMTYP